MYIKQRRYDKIKLSGQFEWEKNTQIIGKPSSDGSIYELQLVRDERRFGANLLNFVIP